jgi:hypothetical protein
MATTLCWKLKKLTDTKKVKIFCNNGSKNYDKEATK